MLNTEFYAACFQNFIGANVISIVLYTIIELFNENSIFKRVEREENPKRWSKRVSEAIKGYKCSMASLVISSVYGALWDLNLEKVFCQHPGLNLGRLLMQIVVYFTMVDCLAYWQHRLFHIRAPINLYKHVHSYHHQFNPVTSYASVAQHPFEAFVSGTFHYFVGIIMSWFLPFDPVGHRIAGFLMLLCVTMTHDGTFCADHLTHHHTVNYNFALGYWRFWDTICGTYKDSSERKSNVLRAKRIKLT